MPDWGEILEELKQSAQGRAGPDFDSVRRAYLLRLHQATKRNVILYAANHTQSIPPEAQRDIQINPEDIQGFMAVMRGLSGPSLDLILHSPGGALEVAEAIVGYLRSKFDDIRVFIPHLALSAATTIACGANRIVMGMHSFLGPIDPQLIAQTSLGTRVIPAQAMLDQFDRAKQECQDPRNLAAWAPMLQQFGPELIVRCENMKVLASELVERWLTSYMFQGQPDAAQKAANLSAWLSDHNQFKSHGRHISRDALESKGFVVDKLEADQVVQDMLLSVFHATTHVFNAAPVLKIIENHLGKAFVKVHRVQQVVMPLQPAPSGAPQ